MDCVGLALFFRLTGSQDTPGSYDVSQRGEPGDLWAIFGSSLGALWALAGGRLLGALLLPGGLAQA